MVYPFIFPTTSHLSFQTFISSSTHPSLPQSASTARHALRLALKTHKRLPRGRQQDAHLSTLLTTLTEYLPYLITISHGLSGKPLETSAGASEEIEITLRSEIETEWRPTISSSSSISFKSRQSTSRVRGRGIDFELAFVLTTLGYTLSHLARSAFLPTFYASTTPTADQRTTAVQTACKYLLQASAVHSLLASSPAFADVTRSVGPSGTTIVPDLDPAAQAALSSLALAEATLLAVWRDDPFIAACIQARNPNDKEWMVRAPEIPKVRALLFARLCVRAAEYAEQSAAGLGSVGGQKSAGVDDDLVNYARVLGRVARARACRFFGTDAELAGKVGEGIAWLRAAKGVLGLRSTDLAGKEESSSKGGLSRLKRGWTERREERKMEKDSGSKGKEKGELGPGDNAGRDEESRVIEMLEGKWVRMNDTVSFSRIF